MKKETLELLRRIYETMKFDVPHPDLEELFQASKSQAQLTINYLISENPFKKEKYEMMLKELDKLTFKSVYNG